MLKLTDWEFKIMINMLRILINKADHMWASWLSGKESACSTGDSGSTPELGRSPGGGNGNSLQYSCLENSMDRGAWQAMLRTDVQCKQRNENPNKEARSLSKDQNQKWARNGKDLTDVKKK